MKLSEETLNLLKNYATINSNLYIEAGSNVVKTWTVTKNIFAKSTIEETFPVTLPIYDLSELLNVIDIFKGGAEIELGEDSLVVGNGTSKVKYQYSDASMLSYPTKNIPLPEPTVSFSLSKEDVSNIVMVSSKLSAPDLSFKNEDGKVVATVFDLKGATGNTYTIELGEYSDDFNFDVHLKTDNLRVLHKDYTVSLFSAASGAPLVHFKSVDEKNEYYIAIERTSKV